MGLPKSHAWHEIMGLPPRPPRETKPYSPPDIEWEELTNLALMRILERAGEEVFRRRTAVGTDAEGS